MNSIFSARGEKKLDKIIRKGVLCAFDFDGTLSPIVSRPDEAFLPPGIGRQLLTLSRMTPVAILTGRAIEDIRGRLSFSPAWLIGNHGLEGLPGWEKHASRYRLLCTEWDNAIRLALRECSGNLVGIEIENKRYSLSVHYRHTPDPQKAQATLLPFLQKIAQSATVVAGKFMYSLVPSGAPNKGVALSELMKISQAPSALYVGDDITDEDIFRLKRKNLLSIHVEKSEDSAAAWYIESHEEMTKLLDELTDRIQSLQTGKTGKDKSGQK